MPRPRKADPAPGSIEQRGDAYRLRLSIGGRVHRFTFPPGTAIDAVRAFARAKADELRVEARKRGPTERRGRGAPVILPPRMADLFATFDRDVIPNVGPRTQVTYRESLAMLRRYFAEEIRNPRVDEVRARDVEGFLTWRRTTPARPTETRTTVSKRTVAKDRAVLHRVFDHAVRQEIRDGNPVARTEVPKAEPHTPVLLTDAELDRLFAAAASRPVLAFYLRLLAESGLRAKSEALWLRWRDVDLDGGFLWVASGKAHRTKSKKGRWVPMTPALRDAYRAHAAVYRLAGAPWLFSYDRARRGHVAGERIGSLDGGARRVIADAKLPEGFRLHDLRHRRVTTWLGAGASPVHVKEAMGHASLSTTLGYTHLVREHLEALVRPEGEADRAKSAQILAQRRVSGGARGTSARG